MGVFPKAGKQTDLPRHKVSRQEDHSDFDPTLFSCKEYIFIGGVYKSILRPRRAGERIHQKTEYIEHQHRLTIEIIRNS